MKLNQLIEMASPTQRKRLANTKWQAPDQIRQWLNANQFKKIGSGQFAEVYASRSSNKVVKFSRGNDKCWLQFAEYAQKHPSKHLPHIYDLHTYLYEDTTAFISIIERLDLLKPINIKYNAYNIPIVCHLFTLGVFIHDVQRQPKAKTQQWINRLKLQGVDLDSNDPNNPPYKQFRLAMQRIVNDARRNNHPWFKVFDDVERVMTAGDQCFDDLNTNNIMYRSSDHSIVLTDPYS